MGATPHGAAPIIFYLLQITALLFVLSEALPRK